MRVRIRRRGGFAGNVTVGAELDTEDLPGVEAARLESVLRQLPWGLPPAGPAHADAFRYELSLPDDQDRGAAVLGEGELDAELSALREHLERAGRPEPPRRAPRAADLLPGDSDPESSPTP